MQFIKAIQKTYINVKQQTQNKKFKCINSIPARTSGTHHIHKWIQIIIRIIASNVSIEIHIRLLLNT